MGGRRGPSNCFWQSGRRPGRRQIWVETYRMNWHKPAEWRKGEGSGQNGRHVQRFRGIESMRHLNISCCSVRGAQEEPKRQSNMEETGERTRVLDHEELCQPGEQLCFMVRAVGTHWRFLSRGVTHRDLHLTRSLCLQ